MRLEGFSPKFVHTSQIEGRSQGAIKKWVSHSVLRTKKWNKTNTEAESKQKYTQCQSYDSWICYIIFQCNIRQTRCHHGTGKWRNKCVERDLWRKKRFNCRKKKKETKVRDIHDSCGHPFPFRWPISRVAWVFLPIIVIIDYPLRGCFDFVR